MNHNKQLNKRIFIIKTPTYLKINIIKMVKFKNYIQKFVIK